MENQTEKDRYLRGDIARELDFYRIRETIASNAVSEEGKKALLEREPCSDPQVIEEYKTLGREWNTYLHSTRPQAITSWPAIKENFRLLGIEGAQLSQEQLFGLGLFCNSTERCKDSITSAAMEMNLSHLNEKVAAMPSLSQAKEEIFRIFTPDGDIKDLPVLREIRSRISSLHKEIENAIRRYTSDSTLSTALQSNVPAYRADRELLAVRADHKNQIKGIVHEVSSSGNTVFIEPEEVVRANNDLIQEEFHLMQEMRKIFLELTARLGEYRDDFIKCFETMILLDTTMAAARWQSSVHGIFAESCNMELEPPVIFEARHPLLGDKAVPVTITFLDGKKVLIITGPNTGGKTVTLKTIALFALLNQAGFPVPASEGTRLPVFSSVFADIGDEQSIDESLSTFSSHMKRTALMIREADDRSLILLDELGSGTDPQEGGAIAMAALDSLIQRKSFVIVTTHHGILKNYGYTNPSCVNASVEFDSDTLRPTYRLLMGVPGESHAIDIALRSGLPEEIVNEARSYISTQQADVSTLIQGLTQKHSELDSLLREQKQKEAVLEEKELKLHQRDINLKERDLELKEAERTKSSEFLRETRKKLENLVRELREGEITREKNLKVKNFIAELTEDVEDLGVAMEIQKEELETEKEKLKEETQRFAENGMRISKSRESKHSSNKKTRQKLSNTEALKSAPSYKFISSEEKKEKPELKEGMEVYAGKAKRKGMLVHREKNASWTVHSGTMKMNVPEAYIEPIPEEGKPKTVSIVVETKSAGTDKDDRPVFELRLLGMHYEEAIKALERQLDLCTIHNFKNFSIIHGKGSGVLQQGVQNYLSHYPGIKDFRFAPPEDGGSGKTYVSLY